MLSRDWNRGRFHSQDFGKVCQSGIRKMQHFIHTPSRRHNRCNLSHHHSSNYHQKPKSVTIARSTSSIVLGNKSILDRDPRLQYRVHIQTIPAPRPKPPTSLKSRCVQQFDTQARSAEVNSYFSSLYQSIGLLEIKFDDQKPNYFISSHLVHESRR